MKLLVGMVVAAALTASCSKRRLTADGGGFSVIDGGGTIDGGGWDAVPFDAIWPDPDPPDAFPDLGLDRGPAGPRSFFVQSNLQRDGGIGAAPESHSFMLMLDANRRTAIVGGVGAGTELPIETSSTGALRIAGPFQCELVAGCNGSSVAYSEIIVAIDSDNRLTGTGRGYVQLRSGDAIDSVAATMWMTGFLDTQAPTLRLSPGFNDPFTPFTLVASEPLAPSATAMLRSLDGETIPLGALGVAGSFVTLFRKPSLILRYATEYRVVVEGLTDFAGHPAAGLDGLRFMTWPPPPLAAEDGFESLTDATFGGVQVLSGGGAQIISGTQSLYVPATTSMPASQPQLALRVPVTAGDTVLRFAYRTAKLTAESSSLGSAWGLGSAGGQATAPVLPPDDMVTTAAAMIGLTQIMLGPIRTASFVLPPDATNEVVLQRTFVNPPACGPPLFGGVSGIIIDDLRVE